MTDFAGVEQPRFPIASIRPQDGRPVEFYSLLSWMLDGPSLSRASITALNDCERFLFVGCSPAGSSNFVLSWLCFEPCLKAVGMDLVFGNVGKMPRALANLVGDPFNSFLDKADSAGLSTWL